MFFLRSLRADAMQKKTDYRHTETRMITRFTIALLGCTAIGISIGRAMPEDLGKLGMIAGGLALIFYAIEARRDLKLRQQQIQLSHQMAEIRLLEQSLPAEQTQPPKSSLYKV